MIQYILWGDPKNQEDTRMMYAKRTPFPFNFYYPKQYLKRADLLFNTLAGFISEDKFEEHRTDEVNSLLQFILTTTLQFILVSNGCKNLYKFIGIETCK